MSGSNCRLTRTAVNMKRRLRDQERQAKERRRWDEVLQHAISTARMVPYEPLPRRKPIQQPLPSRSWLSRLTFGVLG